MLYLMRLFVWDHEVRDDWGCSRAGRDGHLCVVVRVQGQVRDPVDREHPDGVRAAGLEVGKRHARLRARRRRRKRDEWRTDVALDLVLSVGPAAFVKRRVPGEHQGVLIQEPPGQIPRCRGCPGASSRPRISLSTEEAVVATALDRPCVQRLQRDQPRIEASLVDQR